MLPIDIEIWSKKRKLDLLYEALQSGALTQHNHGQAILWAICLLCTELEKLKELKRFKLDSSIQIKTVFEFDTDIIIKMEYGQYNLKFIGSKIIKQKILWAFCSGVLDMIEVHLLKLQSEMEIGIIEYMKKV